MAIEHLHVICYRWGTKYHSEDVNILRAMVARHLPVSHDFHCITDDPAGLDSRIIAHPLPDFGFEGIWRKLMTFSTDFLGLEGQHVASFDLDVVILDSLAFLLDAPEKDFVIARNWGKDGRASGTLYRLKVGSRAHVWDQFMCDPQAAIDAFHSKDRLTGEQTWLDDKIDDFDFFREGKVVSFKMHCNAKAITLLRSRRLGLNTVLRLGVAKPPAGAAVISFHGHPLPRDLLHGPSDRMKRAPFVAQHWHT